MNRSIARSFFFGCLPIVAVGAIVVRAADRPLPKTIEFNRDVQPILSDDCFHCHGPDKNARQANMRLDVRDVATKAADSGETPIVPGKPDKSEVVRRIFSTDPDERMPPPDSHKSLTERQKEVLKLWIAQGAKYQKHWSFEPPVKPQVPAGQNAIDFLVRERLAQIGLHPSPEADRRPLIRRLYFDLLGLPPTPQEVTSFVNDREPDAYENLVDRLMKNPHYGERMALPWLDVVRFADTIGYHSDNPMNVWPYRDWVIKSFNDNKRFDRFTREQLAGDLLPEANQETRVGSAYNRLLLSTEEGGAQPKDYEARMLTDRVRAIGAVWLGLTTGCAQCHDHKYDPLTSRDFYSLGAFFADIKEPILGPREEGMTVFTPQQKRHLAELDAQLAAATKALDAAQKKWESEVASQKLILPQLAPQSKASDGDKKAAERVLQIARTDAARRKPGDHQTLQRFFRRNATNVAAAEHEAFAKAQKARNDYYASLPKVLVSIHAQHERVVRILPRGNFMDESGPVVHPAFPHFLPHPAIKGRELTRLDLANWLVSRQNPLTARTVMNRLWQQFFGVGISRVLDDLGAQGEPPVNPELLDWLACEFMDSGWDMKHMVRLIVTSQTYRQVSTSTPQLAAADPANRYDARQSCFRLDAELVRDNALDIAGLLSPKIGGRSVKPYQPKGYWDNLNFPPREYVADTGEPEYRRGIYVWRQRSFPHPSLLAFDAPSREACTAERTRSNIPQQALVLLNDPTYVEAARAFAARILLECDGSTDERIIWAWEHALQRDPTAAELQTMRNLVDSRLKEYSTNAAAANALLKTGFAPVPPQLDKKVLAAWTHVARVLLNLHETITRS
ncbi:MAG TPA: PSD1 and planctomycete cytochrome C domain-containing protein [Lacipirellulaceae bacterium]|nr:PSD1 and planctomycete cytochrome C domain-containing protein [Lacipirellulaceae bacterium]